MQHEQKAEVTFTFHKSDYRHVDTKPQKSTDSPHFQSLSWRIQLKN